MAISALFISIDYLHLEILLQQNMQADWWSKYEETSDMLESQAH